MQPALQKHFSPLPQERYMPALLQTGQFYTQIHSLMVQTPDYSLDPLEVLLLTEN